MSGFDGLAPGDDEALTEPDLIVLGGSPDADEMAAVTAVLTAVLEELAEERGRREDTGPSAWQRSQRALRRPLHPGPGEWRGFQA